MRPRLQGDHSLAPVTVPPEIFMPEDVQRILFNKFLVIIGDSVHRCIYKDLILLLQEPRRMSRGELSKRGEDSIFGDELIERSKMTNGKDYREVRQYISKDGFHMVRFYFVTRCYSQYMETIVHDLAQDPQPDVVFMNSCLWDISRYGQNSMDSYQKNMQRVLYRLNQILPRETLLVWNATMPVASTIRNRGTFLLPDIDFMNHVLQADVLEANYFAHQVVVDYKFDFLDLHYFFRNQLHHRNGDGVHWDNIVHRRISNLLITHICEAWGIDLPARKNQGERENSAAFSPTASRARDAPPPRPVRRHVRAETCDPSYMSGRYNLDRRPNAPNQLQAAINDRLPDVPSEPRWELPSDRRPGPSHIHNQRPSYHPYQDGSHQRRVSNRVHEERVHEQRMLLRERERETQNQREILNTLVLLSNAVQQSAFNSNNNNNNFGGGFQNPNVWHPSDNQWNGEGRGGRYNQPVHPGNFGFNRRFSSCHFNGM